MLDMTVIDATACIARELGRSNDILVIPMDGGNDIDIAPHPLWGRKLEPLLTYKLRTAEDFTKLTILYRHPFKPKVIDKDLRSLQRHCLKVTTIEPAPPSQNTPS